MRESIEKIRKQIEFVHLKSGQLLAEQGKPLDSIWLLYSGKAEFFRYFTVEGKMMKQVLLRAEAGEVYGYIELFLECNAMMSVKILSDCTGIRIKKEEFQKWMRADPQLAFNAVSSTIIQVRRIRKFLQAVPFLIDKKPKNEEERENEGEQLSKMSLPEIVEKVFGWKISEDSPGEKKLLQCFRRLTLASGEFLYKKGESSKTLWILIKGKLDVLKDNLSYIGAGTVIGEVGLLTEQDRARDLKTLTACELLEITKRNLGILAKHNFDILVQLTKPVVQQGFSVLNGITMPYEYTERRSGEYLFKPDSPSDGMYVLISGRVRIDEVHKKTQRKFFADISHCGEFIGEISMFTAKKHSKYAYAVRDTELVKFSKESWFQIIQANPAAFKDLIQTFGKKKEQPQSQPMKMIAVVQTHNSPNSSNSEFTSKLVKCLSVHGTIRHLTGNEVRLRFPALPRNELGSYRKLW